MILKKIFFLLIMFFINIVYSQNNNNRERLAIMNFSIIGSDESIKDFEWLSQGFSESLNDAFSRIPKFSIVERTQLDKIINEQKLQETKKIDSLSVIKVGKILGVEKILIGSCQIYTGHMMVNMRIVNVETGEISPLNNFPVIEPIENVLLIQKKICLEVLKEFNVRIDDEKINEIESTTNSSTKSIKAYEFFTRGITFYENGQYNDALDMFNIALLSDKKYYKAYHKRGLTNYALEKYDNAVSDFENSEKYIKKDSIYVLIGDTYNKKGDFKNAYEFYKKANKLNPRNNFIKTKLFEIDNKPIIISQKEQISEFETIYEFKNGLAKVKSNEKFGFIDVNKVIIIPVVFDEINDFTDDLAKAKYNSKWGFINKKGDFIIQPLYSNITDFDKNNLARVEIKDKWGIIDKTGKLILPIEFAVDIHYISGWHSEPFMKVAKYKNILKIDYTYGVYDIRGNQILPFLYDDIEIIKIRDKDYNDLDYNFFHVSLDGKWGVVNTKNEIILPFKYKDSECIKPFKDGYAAVKENERWGFANEKGIEIIPPNYERVEEIKFNIFLAKEKEKWGVIDINNIIKIPFTYDKIEILANNYLAVKKDSMWSIVDFENKQICEAKYTSMGSEIKTYSYYENDELKKSLLKIPVKIGKKFFFIDEKCKCIYNCN